MRFSPFSLLLPLLPLLVASCAELTSPGRAEYVAFKTRSDYQRTSEVYRNGALLAKARRRATERSIRVDLSDQRAQLLVEGRVALDTPVCTGKAGKRTPTGTYPIKEKIRSKRSTIFGSLYRRGHKVFRGDRRRFRGRYDRFVGSSLPYWMRLTNTGVGLHASDYVHRYPKSNGCVRVPPEAIATMFAVVKEGTPVVITR